MKEVWRFSEKKNTGCGLEKVLKVPQTEERRYMPEIQGKEKKKNVRKIWNTAKSLTFYPEHNCLHK